MTDPSFLFFFVLPKLRTTPRKNRFKLRVFDMTIQTSCLSVVLFVFQPSGQTGCAVDGISSVPCTNGTGRESSRWCGSARWPCRRYAAAWSRRWPQRSPTTISSPWCPATLSRWANTLARLLRPLAGPTCTSNRRSRYPRWVSEGWSWLHEGRKWEIPWKQHIYS